MIYHFLVKSKPHERIDLLIATSVNIYLTKKNPIVMKTCFSEGKLMKQFGNSLFLRGPPFQLTPLVLSNFFMIPLFAQISKTRKPPNFRAEETMTVSIFKLNFVIIIFWCKESALPMILQPPWGFKVLWRYGVL